jgi:hypothetical protein
MDSESQERKESGCRVRATRPRRISVKLEAQLLDASLEQAHLQGASLERAQLQGASLQASELEATDLRDAFFWHSDGPPTRLSKLRMTTSSDSWGPFISRPVVVAFLDPPYVSANTKIEPWTRDTYDELRKEIGSIENEESRPFALKRIEVLCVDTERVSCHPAEAQNPPSEFASWRERLLAAKVEDDVFLPALISKLRELVCQGEEYAPYVVRGEGFRNRLRTAGAEAKPLVTEAVAKSLDLFIVVSDDFADAYGSPMRSIGTHELRGLDRQHELFAPLD